MPSYLRHEIVLVHYPFSDLSGSKVRPAVIVSSVHPSEDVVLVALTSCVARLFPGEFLLKEWRAAKLNVPTAVKRGIYTIHSSLIVRAVGKLDPSDRGTLDRSLREWLGLTLSS
jgi:mRNA interferase MazF